MPASPLNRWITSTCLSPPPALQVSISAGTKKLVAATAFGAVSLLFLARRFQRRKGRKKAQWEQDAFEIISEKGKSARSLAWDLHLSLLAKRPVCDVIRFTCRAAFAESCRLKLFLL